LPSAHAILGALLVASGLHAQESRAAVDFRLPDLSKLNGRKRTFAIEQLAVKIRSLSGCAEKGVLASELADAADDALDETLQEITTTLSDALRGCPGQFSVAYLLLAQLIHYAHMQAPLDDPRLAAAMAALEAEDREIQQADFTLADLQGKAWTLKDLRGKVVLVNFWQTSCAPCVHEIPALDALYDRFRKKGLVILAIAGDDDAAMVQHFLAAHRVSYPVLLDAGRKVTERFKVAGIPRSIVFDRTGTVVAQVNGSRTRQQFVETLSQAGLH